MVVSSPTTKNINKRRSGTAISLSMWRIRDWSNKQHFYNAQLTKHILMEILSEEFKWIALDPNHFENRHTKNIN